MRTVALALTLAAFALSPPLGGTGATAASSGDSTACHAMHRHSPAVYHHRYGHDAHSFARCVAARDHGHHHATMHHDDNQDD